MAQLHSLLKRQLQHYFARLDSLPPECQEFIDAVNSAYFEFDADRGRLERSLELASEKLIEADSEMRAVSERLIDSSVDGIFAFDRECRYTVWNPALERILGLSKLQTLGKTAFDVFPFLKETGEETFYRDALAGKTAFVTDKQYTVPGTGEQIIVEGHFSPLFDGSGKTIGGLAILRDITERNQAEELRTAYARLAVLRSEVGLAVASGDTLRAILRGCAEAIVRHTGAAFARIWTLGKNEDVLELQASAGMYTHLDGGHSRVPVGELKIGLIAGEKKPHLTNDVANDPRIGDKAWAKSEGMVAFAGYPLIVEDRVVGVMAMFSRRPLTSTSLEALASIADSIAQGIERKLAEGALRHTEAFLAEAQRLSHTGSIGWSGSSGAVYWSEETFRIAELDPASELTTTLMEQKRVHPEDLAAVREAFDRAHRDATDLDLQHRLLMPDGSIKYVHVVAHPVKDESGELEYVGALMDISERKRAEAVLRARERELRQLIDVIPQYMWVYGADERPIYANHGMLDYLGFTLEGLRGDEIRTKVCHPDDLERMKSVREDARRRGEGWELEARILRKDGQYRWFLIRVRPFPDEQGHIVRWYSSATDIEDLKRAEEVLRKSEEFSRTMVDSIPDFACTMTAEGQVEFVNQRILDYTGWTLENLKNWAPLVHRDDLELVLSSWKHSVETGDPYDIEERIRGADGIYRWFHARGIPRRNAEGRITRWYLLLSDIEDLKRAEEALQQAQVELAHVTRVTTLGELAASIAHEINQPLSGIVANGSASLRWLAGDSPDLDEAREATRRVIRDAKRASDVIARIRALSRKTEIQKERMDVNEAIQEVLALAQGQVRRNKVVLKSELAGNLPPVLGDRVQLQQVVLNLIMNAIEAMSAVADWSRELAVRTESNVNDVVQVTVKDSGIGLDPQNTERIFDAFYSTKPGGMGMGLSISRSIVENHGGRLWAMPNDGPGTAFAFTLLKYR